jgi:rhamnogalacturonan endolyase
LLRNGFRFAIIGIVAVSSLFSTGLFEAQAKDSLVFDLPTDSLGMPEDRLSYTMGVGDLDGDGDYDYLARVWIDDSIDKDFKTITYAVRNDGVILWEFHHNMTYRDTSGDPTWIVTLSVWDMDGDGKDEVMTQMKDNGTTKLVMLDGETGNIIDSRSISTPKKINHATIAYLDGINPYLVITQGRDIVTTAYDKDLNVHWTFNNSNYHGFHSWTNIYTADVDADGKDEIVNGALIIDHDGSIYLSGAQWDHSAEGEAGRSIVADIDPDNPGMEWYLIRTGTFNDPYRVQPNYWEGPYLIDLDRKEIIWHHNLDVQDQGWGRMHRGWANDVDSSPGLEMWATGYFWEGNEWQKALNGDYGTPPGPNDVWVDGYSESWFLYAADGTILQTQTGYHVGYPLYWDDDETAEYYRYRGGTLLNKFKGSTLEGGFADANGSGESIQVDIIGDWREEIIVASGYKLYVYSNDQATAYPNRPSPREDHTYLMNMASYGTGLPKPLLPGGGGSLNTPPFLLMFPLIFGPSQ